MQKRSIFPTHIRVNPEMEKKSRKISEAAFPHFRISFFPFVFAACRESIPELGYKLPTLAIKMKFSDKLWTIRPRVCSTCVNRPRNCAADMSPRYYTRTNERANKRKIFDSAHVYIDCLSLSLFTLSPFPSDSLNFRIDRNRDALARENCSWIP